MAKPLSKLRKKICTEIHNNGGWPVDEGWCHLFEGNIRFISKTGIRVKENDISTDLIGLNPSRNKVTFEQYQQFLAEQEYPQAVEPIGLETLLSAWKAANEVVTEQEEKLATAKQVAEEAHKAVQNALSAYGWGKPSLTITDAKDLLPGDVILCIGESWVASNQGKERTVARISKADGVSTSIHLTTGDFGFGFEFVKRP